MTNDTTNGTSGTAHMKPAVLHCVDSYLHTTENWIFRLIKHQTHTQRYIASDRFFDCSFDLPGARKLRLPLQQSLDETSQLTGLRRWTRAASRILYPGYLRVVLRHLKIDIVHSHFAQVGWRYQSTARQLRALHVVSFYGWDYVRLSTINPSWGPKLKRMYSMVDCFICEGPHGASLLVQNGCPESKIRIVKLGVEPDEIPFFHREKRAGMLRLLQVASFKEKKGQIDTLNAFADALQRWPSMHLTFIGAAQGEIHDALSCVIQARGIAEQVSLLPGVKFDELHAAMREHHVFIHPSRHAHDGDCEGGAPVVLLDAQATGMPVISTTHCDIPQEVVDGTTGILCDERDVPSLANAIGFFCEMNKNEYTKYSIAARKYIEQNFDARDCAAAMELLYQELVAARCER